MRTAVSTNVLLAIVGGMLAGAPAAAGSQETGIVSIGVATRPAPDDASPSESAVSIPKPLRASDKEAIAGQWGIQIESLRLTAAGYMLDFRYRVLDAAKAAPLFVRKTKPVLRDEATGAVMAVPVPPKTGALRSSNDAKEGRTYFMFFANPGHFITVNRRVTVTIGDFSVSGLIVR
jgi:hypothetical protein